MEIKCIINKHSVKKNKALKTVQKKARKYYQDKNFIHSPNATKIKISKLADLEKVDYEAVSDIELSEKKNEVQLSKDELIALCREGGLTGRSGNGFDVSRKLEAFHKNSGTLIINAVECDPGLVTDSWLYRNKQSFIQQGAMIIKNALGLDKVILATKEPINAIDAIQQVKVIDRYPMGYENYLIKYVLGVQIAENELPQDRGILVMNLQTVIAIAEMTQNVLTGQYKYITVANLFTAEAKVVRVRIGDCVQEVAESCFPKRVRRTNSIYAGGGAFNCHKVITKERILDTTGYIAIGEMPNYEEAGKCKGCRACTKNCPAGVVTHRIVQHVEKNGMGMAGNCKEFNPTACIGCGACTYSCMAGKDVREVVKWAKMELS